MIAVPPVETQHFFNAFILKGLSPTAKTSSISLERGMEWMAMAKPNLVHP